MVAARVEGVRVMRAASPKVPTQRDAATPMLFQEIRQPITPYLAIPKTSSERREFIPVGFLPAKIVASTELFTVSNAKLHHFGVITSSMHMAWMRAVCGRLKSDFRYSASIVYNNFPWPTPTAAQIAAIETAAQAVLDARAAHPGQSLAWLYNPESMPANLKAAHAALDAAVDKAYGYTGKPDDAARTAFLFGLYRALTTPATPADEEPTRPRKKGQA